MNNPEKTLIVTDMDGTFLGSHATMVQRNVDAINEFKAKGGMFAISTGRHFRDLCSSVPDVVPLSNAPASCCNGSILYDLHEKKMLSSDPMDKIVGKQIVDYIIQNYEDMGIRIAAEIGFVSSPLFLERSEMIKNEYGKTINYCLSIVDTDKWLDFTWYKMVVKGNHDRLETLWLDLNERFRGQVTLSSSGNTTYEIQSPTVNKATTLPALKKYCLEKTGIEPKVICCGDFFNDVDMLKAADISVCPSNAQPAIKEICDYCLCSNNEGLIADVIEKLV